MDYIKSEDPVDIADMFFVVAICVLVFIALW